MKNNNIPEWMIISAFRYALGRRTFIVNTTTEWLLSNWDKLSINTKTIIQNEINTAFKYDDITRQTEEKDYFFTLGTDDDRKLWEKIKNYKVPTKDYVDTYIKLQKPYKPKISDDEILKNIKVEILVDDNQKPIYEYINWKNIPENEKAKFGVWMNGQTTGVAPDGTSAIYVCDYLRWKRKLPCID